jgi:enamine deaminase RidA (YjgF/YER057c/UK114 family)
MRSNLQDGGMQDGRIQDECMAIERFHENDKMSKYVIHNGTVYMSGQVADDPSQDFEGQLTQILAKTVRSE